MDIQEPLPPIPRSPKKIPSENELLKLIEKKNCEEVFYKPEFYDDTKQRSRPMSVPMSQRTIKKRELINSTKENENHIKLVEKEVEGLDPIEKFKKKLIYSQMNSERKSNPKLSSQIQIELKKKYLDQKYKNDGDDLFDENYIYGALTKEKKKKNIRRKKPENIVYDPNSEYMMNFNKKEIETDNLLDYVLNKKKVMKKLNLKEVYMYKSDVDKIRNTIDRNSTSYNTNFNIAGPEYVGADDQVYELCHKKGYISLPKKYMEYYKHLEDQLENDPSQSKSDPQENQIKNEDDKINKAVKIVNKKNTNSKIEINLIKNKNNGKTGKNIKSKMNVPVKTYLGSNSGYNSLSRPALSTSLVQRHNAHRNKEHYNIEQIILRRLRYILNYDEIDKDHIYLIDSLKELKIPDNLIKLSFQDSFESLDELRNEMLDQLLKCKDNGCNIELKEKLLSQLLKAKEIQSTNNIDENKEIQENNKNESKKNIKFEDDTNIDAKENKSEIDSKVDKKINKVKSSSEVSSSFNINGNENEENSSSYYKKKFNLDNPNMKIKHLNNLKPKQKSSVKMRIFPKKQEPTTPRELLYIIDNYNRLNKKLKNDYNRYKTKYSVYSIDTTGIDKLINNNKSLSQNLKSKINNPELSYNEIIKELQK